MPTAPRVPRLPPLPPRPASGRRVLLFRGCVASVYDRDTFAAAQRLLQALGHEVVATAPGDCCGALPRHAGNVGGATAVATATRSAIEASGVDIVLSTASGCFGNLRDDVCAGTAARVLDVHAFLAADEAWPRLRFRPLSQRAALHLPCTQVNVVGDGETIRQLLSRVPGLDVLALPQQPRCCGAAGNHFLRFPETAERLREEKLDQADALHPDVLLTTNIGCRLHLDNGLRARAAALPVLHPLALLAQQLDNRTP